MATKFFAGAEGMLNLCHQFLFLLRQFVGRIRDEGGEVRVFESIHFSFYLYGALFQVDMFKQFASLHAEFRTSVEYACFFFELDDGDGLVHLGEHPHGLLVEASVFDEVSHCELRARVVLVGVHSKGCEWKQVDAVAVLQGRHVAIAHAQAKHVADAGTVACAGAYPFDVVVAPHDVEVLVVAERVHDLVGTWTTVVDVAKQMQTVDCQSLDELADFCDERVGASGVDDGLHDHLVVLVLFLPIAAVRLMEKFLDDVFEVLRQFFSDFRAGVFGRHLAAHANQPDKRVAVEFVQVALLQLHQLQLLLRIVNQGAQFLLLCLVECVAEELVHFPFHVARRIA